MNHVLKLILLSAVLSITQSSASPKLLEEARVLFYDAIENESQIKPAISLFKKIGEEDRYHGKSLTYIGTLYALKGKHSFSPYNKLKWVIRGLKTMDKGIEASPDDLEALFIHGATCSKLPFFFNRGDDAKRSFDEVIRLLPLEAENYDPNLILYVIEFLQENASLEPHQHVTLSMIKNEMNSNGYRISGF